MYRAKSLGKNRHEVFDKIMHERAVRLLQVETDLRRGVERDEFVLHYQPLSRSKRAGSPGLRLSSAGSIPKPVSSRPANSSRSRKKPG
jgi:hypothetical protein